MLCVRSLPLLLLLGLASHKCLAKFYLIETAGKEIDIKGTIQCPTRVE
jgi:hypothetical protein